MAFRSIFCDCTAELPNWQVQFYNSIESASTFSNFWSREQRQISQKSRNQPCTFVFPLFGTSLKTSWPPSHHRRPELVFSSHNRERGCPICWPPHCSTVVDTMTQR